MDKQFQVGDLVRYRCSSVIGKNLYIPEDTLGIILAIERSVDNLEYARVEWLDLKEKLTDHDGYVSGAWFYNLQLVNRQAPNV